MNQFLADVDQGRENSSNPSHRPTRLPHVKVCMCLHVLEFQRNLMVSFVSDVCFAGQRTPSMSLYVYLCIVHAIMMGERRRQIEEEGTAWSLHPYLFSRGW